MSSSLENYGFCEHKLCLYEPLPGKKYCRAHILVAPETIRKAQKLLNVEVARVKNWEARTRLYEQGLTYIYGVRAADAVKFGRTDKLNQRISALQCGCPVELTLCASILAPTELECGIHYYLKPEAHLRGEWFKAAHPRVLRVLELMRNQSIDELTALIEVNST